jgi:hypothetical protein
VRLRIRKEVEGKKSLAETTIQYHNNKGNTNLLTILFYSVSLKSWYAILNNDNDDKSERDREKARWPFARI